MQLNYQNFLSPKSLLALKANFDEARGPFFVEKDLSINPLDIEYKNVAFASSLRAFLSEDHIRLYGRYLGEVRDTLARKLKINPDTPLVLTDIPDAPLKRMPDGTSGRVTTSGAVGMFSNADASGYIVSIDPRAKENRRYELKETMSIAQLTAVFAHELVHVSQMESGRLVDFVDDATKAHWEGKLYSIAPARDLDEHQTYTEQPWEVEAFGQMEELALWALENSPNLPTIAAELAVNFGYTAGFTFSEKILARVHLAHVGLKQSAAVAN